VKKKVAVVLSGCGHKDGTEITEAVSLIVALSKYNLEVSFFAPDTEFEVYDPIQNKPTGEKRNILLESARITRGKIAPLSQLKPSDFSGVAFPGGVGAARNLCDWAKLGASGNIQPEVLETLHGFHKLKKPIAAICIAPVLLAKALGQHGALVTIGDDPETAAEIKKTGSQNESHSVLEFCIDRKNKLFTTPAYMYGSAKPHEVFEGIDNMVNSFVGEL
jgi:enhancing lycopene biosynthesis protein 2